MQCATIYGATTPECQVGPHVILHSNFILTPGQSAFAQTVESGVVISPNFKDFGFYLQTPPHPDLPVIGFWM